MIDPRLARRYARALFTVASERGVDERVGEELDGFLALMSENPSLVAFLSTPRIARADKERVLRAVLEERFDPTVREFLLLLRRKGRFALLEEVRPEYHKILEETRNILTARITSAVPLLDGEREQFTRVLETRTGRSIRLDEVVDPRVIAGVRVMVAGQITDDTVRHHLDTLREELRGLPVHMTPEED